MFIHALLIFENMRWIKRVFHEKLTTFSKKGALNL